MKNKHLPPGAAGHFKEWRHGFTLVELMVSVAILVVLMLVVSNFVGLVQRTWVRANSNASQFREARQAFDILTRNLAQATLNSYWESKTEVVGSAGLGTAILKGTSFKRQSELQFVCGPTVSGQGALFPSGTASTYPGHAVFFQAPLGVTSLVSTSETDGGVANTQGMVNLLCGRGYYVEWGDDTSFRPAFLAAKGVPTRNRFRLMEFSPTAEKNRIYDSALRPITANSKRWFLEPGSGGDARQDTAKAGETAATRSFSRPVAENILMLVISPQAHSVGRSSSYQPTSIAPNYAYDSVVVANAEAGSNPQGTQHLLPPLLKVAMVALDARSGETLSANAQVRGELMPKIGGLFASAQKFDNDLNVDLVKLLNEKRLAYRIFTTTIPLKQARWSK